MTIARSMGVAGFLDRDLLDDVGDLLEGVDRALEGGDDVLELEDLDRLEVAAEELGESTPIALVAAVLEPVDLDPVLVEVGHRAQLRHGLGGDLRAALDDLDLVENLGREVDDLVEQDQVDDLVHVVHHVVETAGQRVDVLAVEGRHEAAVDAPHDGVGVLVADVLGLTHPLRDLGPVRALGDHLGEEAGAGHEVLRGGGEQLVERRIGRTQA
jgi:hypothetical protein